MECHECQVEAQPHTQRHRDAEGEKDSSSSLWFYVLRQRRYQRCLGGYESGMEMGGKIGSGKVGIRKREEQEEEEEERRVCGWPSSTASRIVRVSRASGGKDRHSKVWTSKGLRDRRVRLSVNTAIQFYDLQDRLGYDQPSKAVEWLLKAAAASIDELLRPSTPPSPPFHRPQQQMSWRRSSSSSSSIAAPRRDLEGCRSPGARAG